MRGEEGREGREGGREGSLDTCTPWRLFQVSRAGFKFYVVTCSYSSLPFLCALAAAYSSVQACKYDRGIQRPVRYTGPKVGFPMVPYMKDWYRTCWSRFPDSFLLLDISCVPQISWVQDTCHINQILSSNVSSNEIMACAWDIMQHRIVGTPFEISAFGILIH